MTSLNSFYFRSSVKSQPPFCPLSSIIARRTNRQLYYTATLFRGFDGSPIGESSCTDLLDRLRGAGHTAAWQRELCSAGRAHLQCTVRFARPVSFSTAVSFFGSASPHVEVCAHLTRSIEYCTDPTKRDPSSTCCPHDTIMHPRVQAAARRRGRASSSESSEPGQARRPGPGLSDQILAEILAGSTIREIILGHPTLILRVSAVQAAFRLLAPPPLLTRSNVCSIYFGPPGTGKSHAAHFHIQPQPTMFVIDSALLLDGYAGQTCLLIEDLVPFESDTCSVFTKILSICDVYSQNINVKGSVITPLWNFVFITSNFTPGELLSKCSLPRGAAFMRRIHRIVEFATKRDRYEFTENPTMPGYSLAFRRSAICTDIAPVPAVTLLPPITPPSPCGMFPMHIPVPEDYDPLM